MSTELDTRDTTINVDKIVFGTISMTGFRRWGVVFGKNKGGLQIVNDHLPLVLSSRKRVAASVALSSDEDESDIGKKKEKRYEFLWLPGNSSVRSIQHGVKIVFETRRNADSKVVIGPWALADEFVPLYAHYSGDQVCEICKDRKVLWMGSINPKLERRIDMEGFLPSLDEYLEAPTSFTISFYNGTSRQSSRQKNGKAILEHLHETKTIPQRLRTTAVGRT